jgi:hypothetical protein
VVELARCTGELLGPIRPSSSKRPRVVSTRRRSEAPPEPRHLINTAGNSPPKTTCRVSPAGLQMNFTMLGQCIKPRLDWGQYRWIGPRIGVSIPSPINGDKGRKEGKNWYSAHLDHMLNSDKKGIQCRLKPFADKGSTVRSDVLFCSTNGPCTLVSFLLCMKGMVTRAEPYAEDTFLLPKHPALPKSSQTPASRSSIAYGNRQ